ncbi:ficolin-2-like isoform X1 [Oculina patagonica]
MEPRALNKVKDISVSVQTSLLETSVKQKYQLSRTVVSCTSLVNKLTVFIQSTLMAAGGGWTVFQKRLDGSFDFYRDWADYKLGFGNLIGEFWLGLDKLNRLSSSGRYKLRVDLEDTEGNTAYAEYDLFAVGSEVTKYQLSVCRRLFLAGDSMAYHNGYSFTTNDRDNDIRSTSNCAVNCQGAWWYENCSYSNLNGFYRNGQYTPTRLMDSQTWRDGIVWKTWKGYEYSVKKTEMKIRPVDF